uniref:Uncharacterized protein TCIL3000_1_30 n=1 Tax=Trypanosoma congolense (strain IL3000) TaxID=1068625 RepID=G0UIP5_TRYCI|nr:unnamed protein product [Trypanosoma congolense IL3000]
MSFTLMNEWACLPLECSDSDRDACNQERNLVAQCLQASKRVYEENGETAPDGFEKLDFRVEWKMGDSGVCKASLYKKERDGKKPLVIVAFRGTQFSKLHQWKDNILGWVGVSCGERNAADFARKVNEQYPQADVVFTGHSKGGAEAIVAAATVGGHAIVFNPRRVAGRTLLRHATGNPNIRIHRVEGELFGGLDLPTVVGGGLGGPILGKVFSGFLNVTLTAALELCETEKKPCNTELEVEVRVCEYALPNAGPVTAHSIEGMERAFDKDKNPRLGREIWIF